MQISIDTTHAQKTLIKEFSKLGKKKVDLSIYRSINAALRKTQTASIRAITGRYTLTRGQVAKKFYVVQARASAPYMGYLKAYNNPFTLGFFNPRMLKDGVATGKMGSKGAFASRKVKGLKINNKLTNQNGVIVTVIRGQDKIIPSAFLAFRQGKAQPSVSARGEYNRGFGFDGSKGNKSLRGVGVVSAINSNDIRGTLIQYAENEYLRILYEELQKRVKGIGEQHARL